MSSDVPLSEQQLQQLCSSCPAVQHLEFVLLDQPSRTSLLPLLQLSALTQLGVSGVKGSTAYVVSVAAQLTRSQGLTLLHVLQPT
jgi:hypothetical protein